MNTSLNTDRVISPSELMFFRDEEHYFAVGESAIEVIERCLKAAQKPEHEIKKILDLPCGHGRVLRYLKAMFPEADLTACDLLTDGVDFCATQFGATPIYSKTNPREIGLPRDTYDLIWVGSLLTHLDKGLFTAFLKVLTESLSQNGILVFTTHGRYTYHELRCRRHFYSVIHQYESTGFGWADSTPASGYGVALSSTSWVMNQIEKLPETRVAFFSERAWDAHQDVFACVRDREWNVQHEPLWKERIKRRLRRM